MKRLLLAVLLLLTLVAPALAVKPDEVLADPALEARARAISHDLRCLVCQNQSIDDSDADLARDLRLLVRERLVAGDSNEQAVQYLVDRYGEFVLLRPVFAWHTLVLWVAGPAILVIGLGVIGLSVLRRRRQPVPVPASGTALTAEEAAALQSLRDEPRG